MRRVTLSLDDSLADAFDQWARTHAYQNRSEAFRDLLRGRLAQEQADAPESGTCVATVSYVYDHHERQLSSRLASQQHAHHGLNLSTLHVHLDHDNCLETTALRGPTAQVRAFAEALIAERGVRNGAINLIPIGALTPHVQERRRADPPIPKKRRPRVR